MHVAFVIARFRPALGGTERQAELLAAWLGRRGVRVTVLTHANPPATERERDGAVEVLRLPPPAGGRMASVRFCAALARSLEDPGVHYDAIQVFLASAPALVARRAARRRGLPALLKLGGSGPTGDVGTSSATALGRWKLRRLKTGFARYLCPNAAVRDEFLSVGYPAANLVPWPNGVDDGFHSPLPPEQRDSLRGGLGWSGRTVALFLGRFDPGNLERLLEAWEIVARRRPGALLVLAGEGDLRARVDSIVRERFVADAVRVLPAQDSEGVRRLLRGADLFVLPSLAEGLSNALLEAMACGVTPAVSDIPGSREIVAPLGAGVTFSPLDAGAMAVVLENLVADAGAREALGRAGREAVRAACGIDTVGRRYLDLLAEVGAGGG